MHVGAKFSGWRKRQRPRKGDAPATWAASHTGPRPDNQDYYGRADHETRAYDWHSQGCIYVLADGMGGLASGATAARIAVKEIVEQYRRSSREASIRDRLVGAVQQANRRIYAAGQSMAGRMGSTVVACILKDNKAVIAHAGDSRAYHLHGDTLTRCTRDHLYGTQVLKIEDDDEAKRGPEGHMITRALGKDPEVEVDSTEVEYGPEDRFLLCSDGISEVLLPDEIQACLQESTPRKAVQEIFSLAGNRLNDNATAIVVFPSGRRIRSQARLRMALQAAALVLVVLALGLTGWAGRRQIKGAAVEVAGLLRRPFLFKPSNPSPEAKPNDSSSSVVANKTDEGVSSKNEQAEQDGLQRATKASSPDKPNQAPERRAAITRPIPGNIPSRATAQPPKKNQGMADRDAPPAAKPTVRLTPVPAVSAPVVTSENRKGAAPASQPMPVVSKLPEPANPATSTIKPPNGTAGSLANTDSKHTQAKPDTKGQSQATGTSSSAATVKHPPSESRVGGHEQRIQTVAAPAAPKTQPQLRSVTVKNGLSACEEKRFWISREQSNNNRTDKKPVKYGNAQVFNIPVDYNFVCWDRCNKTWAWGGGAVCKPFSNEKDMEITLKDEEQYGKKKK